MPLKHLLLCKNVGLQLYSFLSTCAHRHPFLCLLLLVTVSLSLNSKSSVTCHLLLLNQEISFVTFFPYFSPFFIFPSFHVFFYSVFPSVIFHIIVPPRLYSSIICFPFIVFSSALLQPFSLCSFPFLSISSFPSSSSLVEVFLNFCIYVVLHIFGQYVTFALII
jgi:hypothetical protein